MTTYLDRRPREKGSLMTSAFLWRKAPDESGGSPASRTESRPGSERRRMRYRFSVWLVVLALLAVPAVPAFALQLPWSKGCSTGYGVVSHGQGTYWQNHVRGVYSQYYSYSGHQARNAYWGVPSGSGYVDSTNTNNVYGWCSHIS